ncbi:TPA: hypothetical protein ACT5B5_007259, partial [Burkholderia cenocepacia]
MLTSSGNAGIPATIRSWAMPSVFRHTSPGYHELVCAPHRPSCAPHHRMKEQYMHTVEQMLDTYPKDLGGIDRAKLTECIQA